MTPEPPRGIAYEEAVAAQRRRAAEQRSAAEEPRAAEQGSAGAERDAAEGGPAQPYDPLKLCVYTTVALLAWLLGPWAVLGFAVLGLVGYWRARRAGLTRSKCLLRDTRLVLAYLGLIAVAAIVALVLAYVPR
ncbi:hypothetical protein [Planotetraspora sp. GP83]|uniref:hypothetical protein n=1 Tax=Planotetraspora sp. GP83 TaxID=3156264 RepID=UPI0035115DA7